MGKVLKRLVRIVAAFVLVTGAAFGFQSNTHGNDLSQINNLLTGISSQSITLANALDPSLSPSQRTQEIQRFSASHYELTVTPKGQSLALRG
jgi:hypothetical protein